MNMEEATAAVATEIALLVKIARRLADAGEPLDDDYNMCILCDPTAYAAGKHEDECPWVLAVKWTQQVKETDDLVADHNAAANPPD